MSWHFQEHSVSICCMSDGLLQIHLLLRAFPTWPRAQLRCATKGNVHRGGATTARRGGPSIGSSHAERLHPYLLCWILWTDYTPSTFFPLPIGLRPHKTLPLYIGWICTSLILPVNRPSVIWTILIISSLDYFKASASATGRVNSP